MSTGTQGTLRLASVLALGLAMAGCAAGAGWGASIFVLMAALGLAVSGCSSSHSTRSDAGVELGDASTDQDAGGHWEHCCVEGRVDSCFCPGGASCNYGWYEDCGDGLCAPPGQMCPAVDAGTPDAGGTWDACCVDGQVDSCFCPAGVACNYGWFEDCGDGLCVSPGQMCPAVDAGTPDAGGTWEPCCVEGMITTCHCPAGAICNYGWYEDCGDGMCASGPESCPP